MNNSLTVVGYISQPPKIKRFASGKQCVEFSIAVKEWELDENGENRTLFLDVKAFNGGEMIVETIVMAGCIWNIVLAGLVAFVP